MSSSDLTYAIFGMGNPLLDISAVVPQETLDKWGVTLNNAILAEEKHVPLYAELAKEFPVEYIAGGATQNSIRVAQWAIQAPNATTYTGCVGDDAFGAQLAKSATADGVRVLYQTNPDTPTGTCAVLIKDHERSLIANLSAANKFTLEHMSTPAVQEALQQARIFYSSGFFLTVSPPSFQAMAKIAHSKPDTTVALNLAAPFIPQFFSEPLLEAIRVSDLVFGNESEAAAFAEQQKLPAGDAKSVALHIAAMPQREGATRPRVAVVTQGPGCTFVACDGKVEQYDVPPLSADQIVDANGAGDAFVGGYLAQLAKGKSVAECVKAGHYCARTILQVSGTALPTTKPDPECVVP